MNILSTCALGYPTLILMSIVILTRLTEVGIGETAVGEYSLFAFTCSCGSAEGKWDLIQRESVVPALQAVVPIPSFWFLS